MRYLFFNIGLLLLAGKAFGQTHHIIGTFPTLDLKYTFSPKFEVESYHFLSYFPQSKTIDDITYPAHSSALYTELDFTYNLNPNLGITASYTYERVSPFESNYRNENRLWLQASLKSKTDQLEIKNRLRYDFRFIQNRSTGEVDYLPRVRYFLGLAHPIQKKENPLVLSVYNEAFFNTFSGASPFYAENWASLGIKQGITDKMALEYAYLNISWLRDNANNWLSQHYAQITLYLELN